MSELQKLIKTFAITLAVLIIISILMLILSFLLQINHRDDNVADSLNLTTEVYNNINNLEIDLKNYNLTIKKADKFKIDYDKTANLKFQNKHNKLIIKQVGFFNKKKLEVSLYIPDNFNVIEIDQELGSININDISIQSLEVDIASGDLKINNVNILKTNIDGAKGEININSSVLNNFELDSGVGQVNITAALLGNSQIDSGIGDVNLTLVGSDEEYKVDCEKGTGKITINGINQKGNAIYGNGFNYIEIDGGMGNIDIQFTK